MASTSASVLPSVHVGGGLSPLPDRPSARSSSRLCPAGGLSLRSGSSALEARLARSSNVLAFGPGARRSYRIVAMASSEGEREPVQSILDSFKGVQEAWDKVDDKLAIGGLGFAALLVLWASTGLIGAIDKLPIIPDFFELVGILFSGWFVYRYLLFKPDREELLLKVEEAKKKITGQ